MEGNQDIKHTISWSQTPPARPRPREWADDYFRSNIKRCGERLLSMSDDGVNTDLVYSVLPRVEGGDRVVFQVHKVIFDNMVPGGFVSQVERSKNYRCYEDGCHLWDVAWDAFDALRRWVYTGDPGDIFYHRGTVWNLTVMIDGLGVSPLMDKCLDTIFDHPDYDLAMKFCRDIGDGLPESFHRFFTDYNVWQRHRLGDPPSRPVFPRSVRTWDDYRERCGKLQLEDSLNDETTDFQITVKDYESLSWLANDYSSSDDDSSSSRNDSRSDEDSRPNNHSDITREVVSLHKAVVVGMNKNFVRFLTHVSMYECTDEDDRYVLDVDVVPFKAFIQYLYTGNPGGARYRYLNILTELAYEFQVHALIELCIRDILDNPLLPISKVTCGMMENNLPPHVMQYVQDYETWYENEWITGDENMRTQLKRLNDKPFYEPIEEWVSNVGLG